MEKCQRCEEVGDDRRTLWMACFYNMNELLVPFTIQGAPEARNGQDFYTLRVCKRCRADWMKAISAWWFTDVKPKQETGTGVFVRENGATVELTESQVKERFPEAGFYRVSDGKSI